MTHKSKPRKLRFSIVIPAYNEADYIAATLKSLKKLTFDGSYEVIVVDNNSTDNTAAIAAKHGATVITEKQPGVCFARQAGTQAAKGEIIVSTDADTTYDPEWLTHIDDEFNKFPDTAAVAGPCRYIGGPVWGRAYARLLFGLVAAVYALMGRTFYVSATNIAFKKNLFDGYDTNLPQGGDELDIIRRLKKKGPVRFNNDNPTFTSSRRLERGFVYNFIVSWLIFYILEYNLNRLFGRPILGASPSFRTSISHRKYNLIRLVVVSLIVVVLFIDRHRILHMVSNAVNLL